VYVDGLSIAIRLIMPHNAPIFSQIVSVYVTNYYIGKILQRFSCSTGQSIIIASLVSSLCEFRIYLFPAFETPLWLHRLALTLLSKEKMECGDESARNNRF
jgi:hypothetical protein